MKKAFLGCVLAILPILELVSQTSLAGKKFQSGLSSIVYGEQKVEVGRELSKEVSVIRFLDPENVRIEFELEIWGKFIQAVDSSLVGFVFYANGENESFQIMWKKYIPPFVPLIIDKERKIAKNNSISLEPAFQTLILKNNLEILTHGGAPIVSENFNGFRNSIALELQSQGYNHGVIGVIIDHSKDQMAWFMGEPIYYLPNGQKITTEEAMDRIMTGGVYPQFSSLTDTVRLVKRNQ